MKKFKKYLKDLAPISKGLLLTILLLLIGVVVLILVGRNNRLNDEEDCKCYKYKKFKQNTVYPDGRYDVKIDSICTIYSIGGTIVSKQFQ